MSCQAGGGRRTYRGRACCSGGKDTDFVGAAWGPLPWPTLFGRSSRTLASGQTHHFAEAHGGVVGWCPRYLAHKRERGPARVPKLLSEGYNVQTCWPLRPGTMKGHGYVTIRSRQVGAVFGDLCCAVDGPQHHPVLGDLEWGSHHLFLATWMRWGSSFGSIGWSSLGTRRNEWVTGPSSPRLDVTVTTASTSDPSLVSWLYAPHGSDCRFLRDKGQSTVSGITWTSFVCSHAFRCVSHGGMGSLSTGLPSGRGSGRCTLA